MSPKHATSLASLTTPPPVLLLAAVCHNKNEKREKKENRKRITNKSVKFSAYKIPVAVVYLCKCVREGVCE